MSNWGPIERKDQGSASQVAGKSKTRPVRVCVWGGLCCGADGGGKNGRVYGMILGESSSGIMMIYHGPTTLLLP